MSRGESEKPMPADTKNNRTWIFYGVPVFARLKVQFICDALRHEGTFRCATKPRAVFTADGTAFGKRIEVEAIPTGVGSVPDFNGRFEVGDGPCGDFHMARGLKGQLLSLGVYGVPPVIRLFMVSPSHVKSPLILEGLPGCDAVFEDLDDASRFRMPGRPKLPRRPSKVGYAGWCTAQQGSDETTPPYAAVLTVLLVCYESLLLPNYLDTT